jgi:bifunctional DNA-binding transcriptional regulator/antitoxin component of YhaV-PrlF toxin-antitoxin module
LESPPFFAEYSPVYSMQSAFPLTVGPDGTALLPGEVRWALSLNPGDLLLAEWDQVMHDRFTFQSYAEKIRTAADAFTQPWPWIEKFLAMPMAAVTATGGLLLPKAAAVLLGKQPGTRQLLRAGVDAGRRWFSVQMQEPDQRQIPEEIRLEARHTLDVEPGFRVTLPADVLWALSLSEGDVLVCESRLATADLRALAGFLEKSQGKLQGRRLMEIEPGGKLSLPDAVCIPAIREPGAWIDLRTSLWKGEASLRLTPSTEI